MLRDSHSIDKLFEQIIMLVPKMDPVIAGRIDQKQILDDSTILKAIAEIDQG